MEGDLLNELINAAENLVNNTQNNQIREIDIFNEEEGGKTSNDTNNGSVVHTGLSDSSDDEDNKYFEEAKYNEYGKNIKQQLQNSNVEGTQFTNRTDTWKTKLAVPESKPVPSKDIFVDPFFGIRIINPLISSKTFQERMVDRESVPMVKLKWYVQKLTPEKNWVIAGVIVQKSATKTSQKGNQFCIWTLSDLHGDLKTATVFLFGKAYQNLWKTVLGTVVGILNPNVFDKKETRAEACLSIDNHQKIMILGQSKDFGICKSTKKSGESCTAFVNTNQSEHCIYHLKQEYQKYSKRSDMQSSFQGRGLTALRNKVLGKNEVFYAGKSYTAIPASKSRKLSAKDDSTLKALKGNAIVNSNQVIKAKNLSNRKKTANRVELDKNQRAKDMALLRRLGGNEELDINLDKKSEFVGNLSKEVSLDESKQTALSVINRLKESRLQAENGNDNRTKLSMDKKSEFVGNLSKEVSLDESKQAALSVINRLKGNRLQAENGNDNRTELSKEVVGDAIPKKKEKSSKNEGKTEEINGGIHTEQQEINAEDIQAFMSEIATEINIENPNTTERVVVGDAIPKKKKKSSKNEEKTEEINGGTYTEQQEINAEDMNEVSKEINIENPNNTEQVLAGDVVPKKTKKSSINKEKTIEGTQSTSIQLKSRPFLNNVTTQPFLRNNPGTAIDLNSPISKKLVDKAKLNAIKYVQKNGKIKKSDPMSVKSTGKKRLTTDTNFLDENDPKKQKIQENEFFSDRFKKMMSATSTHTDLLQSRDDEEQEKYFKKLEIKEKMEEKMATTFKIECKAVRCLKCKYTNFSASDRCKAEKHPLRVFDTFKRFFKCGECGNRTVCLEVVPIVACKNCGSGKWERSSMMKERNVKQLHSLSIRGGEQKFLNSTVSDTNLSLLVSMD